MISTQVRTIKPLHPTGREGRFSHDPVTIDLNHLAAVAAKAKGRLAGAAQSAAAKRRAVAAALKKRAALRRNPATRATCVALDKSVHGRHPEGVRRRRGFYHSSVRALLGRVTLTLDCVFS